MKITHAAATAVIITFIFALLTLGKDLLIPMVLAIFIWYLINILADSIALLQIGKFRLPRVICFILALFVIIGSLTLFTNLVSSSINNVIKTAPTYQANVEKLIDEGSSPKLTFQKFCRVSA
jgi:AI-2 transport protein TqsA